LVSDFFDRRPVQLTIGGIVQHPTFQIPTLRGFITLISTPELLGELSKAPENVLSMTKPLNFVCGAPLFSSGRALFS
jgi:hypothetical protein